MVNRRRETVEIGDEHVDLVFIGFLLGHVDHRQYGAKIVAYGEVVVGAEAGKNCWFCHSFLYYNPDGLNVVPNNPRLPSSCRAARTASGDVVFGLS